jgi:hypothetical protein
MSPFEFMKLEEMNEFLKQNIGAQNITETD